MLAYCLYVVGPSDRARSDGEYRISSSPSEPLQYRSVLLVCRLYQDCLCPRKANFLIDQLRARQIWPRWADPAVRSGRTCSTNKQQTYIAPSYWTKADIYACLEEYYFFEVWTLASRMQAWDQLLEEKYFSPWSLTLHTVGLSVKALKAVAGDECPVLT